LDLAQHINEMEFDEYPAVAAAWMKVANLVDLRWSTREDADRELLERYARGDAGDAGSQRAMIRLFLQDWLVFNVPENIGVWGLEVGEFRPVSREEALRAADRIVAACQPDADAAGPLPPRGGAGIPSGDPRRRPEP
jgi:hypothetical protein